MPTTPPSSSQEDTDSPQARHPAVRFLRVSWRIASSTWLGVILLTALCVEYGVLSIVEQLPGPKSWLPGTGSVYGHWSIVTLTFLFLANLIFATSKIPVRWDRAGAWCSHLGLMFMAVGSVAFWRTRTEGQCFIPRSDSGGWVRVDYFFKTSDDVACYVFPRLMGRLVPDMAVKTKFDSPVGTDPVNVDVPLRGTPDDVSARVTKIYPRAEFKERWVMDEVARSLAVEVLVSDKHGNMRSVMCESYPETTRIVRPECVIDLDTTRPPPSQESIDRNNEQVKATSQPARSRKRFVIHYNGMEDPVLFVRDETGLCQLSKCPPGRIVPFAEGDESAGGFRVIGVSSAARFDMGLTVPPDSNHKSITGALELTINAGSKEYKRIVPYFPYLTGRPTLIRLPSGRAFYVAFSGSHEPLPQPLQITRHEYKTAPASRMAEDYICDLEIGSGVRIRKETLRLNYPITVGPYRLSQSTWHAKDRERPDYNDPASIVLGVADRPGILLIFIGGTAVCLGFPYAFYVKPLILKSRIRRAAA